ncbi:MAG: WD40 repeat domain-containing protein [Planctomycetes bacterium]|nr:WD40 repeat domain-containing protein [Planctomycetota bacterium]
MQTFQTETCLRHDLRFSPDGRRLMIGSGWPVLFDTHGTEPPVTLKPLGGRFAVHARFALGGSALVYAADGHVHDGHVHVWDFATGHERVRKHAGPNIRGLAVDPGGAVVYETHITPDAFSWRTEVRAFDVATGEPRGRFPAHEGAFAGPIVSADGRRLAGCGSWSACVWDLTAPDAPESAVVEVRAGKLGTHLDGIALSADGTWLATINHRGLTLWDVSGASASEVFRSGKHRRRVSAVACGPTRPVLATGDTAGQVFLWDHTGRVLNRYDWGLSEVYALCFAPDGLRCAVADGKGKIVVWDLDA